MAKSAYEKEVGKMYREMVVGKVSEADFFLWMETKLEDARDESFSLGLAEGSNGEQQSDYQAGYADGYYDGCSRSDAE